jgi:endoglucanase
MSRLYRLFVRIALAAWVLNWITGTYQPAQAQDLNYLHTEGNRILDSNGSPVIITGISWFGLETENFAPHGLWARSLDSFLDQIVELGFNTIRLPYSNQLLDPSSVPNGINYDLNPDLQGLNGLEIMDRVIEGAGKRSLKVILDRHRPDSHAQSELWYTPQYSEERWISDWVMLVERYAGDDTVIGVDLHNEPHGPATWGSGDTATDWRLAAERAGNAILKANPNLLIVVQGVQEYQGDTYWWGGNLMGAREHPVRLDVPGRLVYSPHTYGPGVYPQPWFSDPSFPDNMPEIWDRHWGYLDRENIAPVVLGEFGGRSVKNDQEGIWQRALVAYLKENEISYVYWSLNPNSGDTGGILLDDWQSIDPEKEELLASYQFPLIGDTGAAESGQPTPAKAAPTAAPPAGTALPSIVPPTQPPAADASPTAVSLAPGSAGLRVKYHTSSQSDLAVDSKPEFIIFNTGASPVRYEDLDLVYWFKDDPGQTYLFNCDWAQIGCENVSGEFIAGADGDYSLRIHFQPGLAPLAPGEDSGEIKLRFNRSDWSEFNQSDDYSFSAASGYEEWEKVCLYLGGTLVWGSEPGMRGVSTATVPAVTPSATSLPATPSSGLPTPSAAAASPEAPSTPALGWLVITALAAFVVGVLVAVILILRRSR